MLSHEPDAKYWLLTIDAKQITGPKWPNKYLIKVKLVVSQIIIDLSLIIQLLNIHYLYVLLKLKYLNIDYSILEE